MSAQILTFRTRTPAAPATYRASDAIEIVGLMIRGFGIKTDATGAQIAHATLTDFISNGPVDLGLVIKDAGNPINAPMVDQLMSGDALGVYGYPEMIGEDQHFVVLEVTRMRVRDLADEALKAAYFQDFTDTCEALRTTTRQA